MSVEFHRESHGKFDSRTLRRETLSRWTGRTDVYVMFVSMITHIYLTFGSIM